MLSLVFGILAGAGAAQACEPRLNGGGMAPVCDDDSPATPTTETNGVAAGYACHANQCSVSSVGAGVSISRGSGADGSQDHTSPLVGTAVLPPAPPPSPTSLPTPTPTPAPTPTVSQAQQETQGAFEHQVNQVAADSSGEQQSSLKDAQEVSSLGANRAATIGALYCAEGALKLFDNPDGSAADFAACHDNFAVAGRLSSAALKPDSRVLASLGAGETLGNLESTFGVSREDYVSGLLGGRGSRESMSDVLGSKLPADKLQAAYAAADALPQQVAPADFSVNLAAPSGTARSARAPALSAMRAKLKERIEQAAQAPAAASAKPDEDHIEPLAHGDFFSFEEPVAEAASAPEAEAQGLTLFDVVHRKYASLAKRHRAK